MIVELRMKQSWSGFNSNKVLPDRLLVLYSQRLIFFVTYELAQKVKLLDNTRPERLASYKYSGMLCPSC